MVLGPTSLNCKCTFWHNNIAFCSVWFICTHDMLQLDTAVLSANKSQLPAEMNYIRQTKTGTTNLMHGGEVVQDTLQFIIFDPIANHYQLFQEQQYVGTNCQNILLRGARSIWKEHKTILEIRSMINGFNIFTTRLINSQVVHTAALCRRLDTKNSTMEDTLVWKCFLQIFPSISSSPTSPTPLDK